MDFSLKRGQCPKILFSGNESEAVKTAVSNLEQDLRKVLGNGKEDVSTCIIIGTLGISVEIEQYINLDRVRYESGELYKEAYIISIHKGNLIIAGTDRRGTIYGIYEFCEMLGVSPWYFWADVPTKKRDEFSLPEGFIKSDYPSVEYRGIFINDEEELEAWVKGHMEEPTIGVKTYEKIFELLLRLKGNYIWPAMHVNSFNAVPENGALADKMGIVVGTSHCDMLMRSNNREWLPWIKSKGYTDAVYDYSIEGRNREILNEYWRESVEQNKEFEVSYTLGMRGIHDSGFETKDLEGITAEEKIKSKVRLLENIIHNQRKILKDVLGRETLTTFVPYKEVLELYDNGLEIPEDTTVIWANDNYGYIRRYPSDKEKNKGNGIYYHNSYWSAPSMSYVFICSIPLAHTGNELRKAYNEGIKKLWVLNCGAMKPLEQEIEFFLRLAWEIGKENTLTENVDLYLENWINKNFSGGIGKEIAAILNDFSQLTNVRKIENMDYDAFSQTSYGDEAVIRINQYKDLFDAVNTIYNNLPDNEKNSFFQMVAMKIHAAYFTNCGYYYGDRSTLCCNQRKMQAAAYYAEKSLMYDDIRRKMIIYYNKIMAGGKWDGILDPEGFPPPRAAMMPVSTPPISIGDRKMLVNLWNDGEYIEFSKPGTKWFEIANAGEGAFEFSVTAPEWVALSEAEGVIETEKRILVTVKAGNGLEGIIKIQNLSCATRREIRIKSNFLDYPNVEEDGIIAINGDTSQELAESPVFKVIPRLGRWKGNLVEAVIAQTAEDIDRNHSDFLSYPFYVTGSGKFLLEIHRFPSLNSTGRIRVGISVDDFPIQVVESYANDEWRANWKQNVLNNVDKLYLKLPYLEKGCHVIYFYAIDKYFAFSRFVLYTAERRENSLGGAEGNQSLPLIWDIEEWVQRFYGDIKLKPRPVEYAIENTQISSVDATAIIHRPERYARRVTPDKIIERGKSIFTEENEDIRIDAASALAQTEYAYTDNYEWQYSSSDSYGRSGLSMYIRKLGQKWENTAKAPSLSYRLSCKGGEYKVWLLTKMNTIEESYLWLGIDGELLPSEKLYRNGSLYRYEGEQIWRWVPFADIWVKKGEHLLQVYSLASGLRIDRIYLSKNSQLPPRDIDWIRTDIQRDVQPQ